MSSFADRLESAVTYFIVPLMLLNAFGSIVSGIWLAVLGEWDVIGIGIGIMIFGAFGLGFVMLPGLIFAGPAFYFEKKNLRFLFYFFGFLSASYTILVVSTWCIFIFVFFVQKADNLSIIPILIWSYGIACGVLSYMASSERDNDATILTLLFAQLGYIAMCFASLFFGATMLELMIVFGCAIGLSLILNFANAIAEHRNTPHLTEAEDQAASAEIERLMQAGQIYDVDTQRMKEVIASEPRPEKRYPGGNEW